MSGVKNTAPGNTDIRAGILTGGNAMATKTIQQIKQETKAKLDRYKITDAVRRGSLKDFLALGGASACDDEIWNALVKDAISFERLDILEYLIEKDPRPDEKYDTSNFVKDCLNHAAVSGALKSAKFLLDYGQANIPADIFGDILFNAMNYMVYRITDSHNLAYAVKMLDIFAGYGFDINEIRTDEKGNAKSLILNAAQSGHYNSGYYNIVPMIMDHPKFDLKHAIRYDGGYSLINSILCGEYKGFCQDIGIKLIQRVLAEKDVLDLSKQPDGRPSLINTVLLHYTSEHSAFQLIKILLDAGVPLKPDNQQKGSAMNLIAESNFPVLKKYIEEYLHINYETKLTASQQRMFNAVRDNDIDALRKELANGVDPNTIKNPFINRLTALHMAMLRHQNKDIVQELLAAGADPNIRDINGDTPLDILYVTDTMYYYKPKYNGVKLTDIYSDNGLRRAKNCIRLMIDAGSENPPNICKIIDNYASYSQCHQECQWEKDMTDILKMVVDAGYKLDIQDLFVKCIQYQLTDMAKEMIKLGADVNLAIDQQMAYEPVSRLPKIIQLSGRQTKYINTLGFTPVFAAAINGDVKMIKLLVDNGANPYVKENGEMSAEDIFKFEFPEQAHLFDNIIMQKINADALVYADGEEAAGPAVDFNI
jgi:ankyrin repeat protein